MPDLPELPVLPDGFIFHHLGCATSSIAKDKPFFEFLGYQLEGKPFSDPVQGIAGCFMVGVGPRIELLENLPGRSTLTPWIDAGLRIYHFAYVVEDLETAIEWARSKRGRLTVPPVPAIAFAGREICFVIFPNKLMLEFIQK